MNVAPYDFFSISDDSDDSDDIGDFDDSNDDNEPWPMMAATVRMSLFEGLQEVPTCQQHIGEN